MLAPQLGFATWRSLMNSTWMQRIHETIAAAFCPYFLALLFWQYISYAACALNIWFQYYCVRVHSTSTSEIRLVSSCPPLTILSFQQAFSNITCVSHNFLSFLLIWTWARFDSSDLVSMLLEVIIQMSSLNLRLPRPTALTITTLQVWKVHPYPTKNRYHSFHHLHLKWNQLLIYYWTKLLIVIEWPHPSPWH